MYSMGQVSWTVYVPQLELGSMKAKELNAMIPYAKGGREKILMMSPYENIKLLLPGRHAMDTVPVGGDFCVCVTDEELGWDEHQFTHTDLFSDVQRKKSQQPKGVSFIMEFNSFMGIYMDIVKDGISPPDDLSKTSWTRGTLHPQTFLYTVQCLAVAEHRRYWQHEPSFGGRYLPFRFAAGIVDGLWSADDCVGYQNQGRHGVEKLETQYGLPLLTKKLMGLDET